MEATAEVINEQRHAPLLADIATVANAARIPEDMILSPLTDYCAGPEIDWLRGIRRHMKTGRSSLLFVGRQNANVVADRMMAMAGALVRNYIDAKVYSMADLLEALRKGNKPEARVLLIPDFCLKATQGHLQVWQVNAMYGFILSRVQTSACSTVLYVENDNSLRSDYGDTMEQLLAKHFAAVPA